MLTKYFLKDIFDKPDAMFIAKAGVNGTAISNVNLAIGTLLI